MHGTFFRGVVLGSLTAALVLGASAALAGTGVGGIFNLGKSNSVNGTSSLRGTTAGSQLSVSNSATSSGAYGLLVTGASAAPALRAQNSLGPAATFKGGSNSQPFTVSSTQRVANLNSDLLDGLDSSLFYRLRTRAATNAITSVALSGANDTR